MRRSLIDILVCPMCKSSLTLTAAEGNAGEVISGSLTCQGCAAAYPVEGGIPNLLPKDLREL